MNVVAHRLTGSEVEALGCIFQRMVSHLNHDPHCDAIELEIL